MDNWVRPDCLFYCLFYVAHFSLIDMLLAVDIGNTSIKFGAFDGDRLSSKFVIPSKREYTQADIDVAVDGRLDSEFNGAVVSSVVPEIDQEFSAFISARFGLNARFVTTRDDFDLTFNYPMDEAG